VNNLDCWIALQAADYFENHRCYRGLNDHGPHDVEKIETFVALKPTDVAVVIGCGYGREAAHIAPRVAKVYGIDVSDKILDKASQHLKSRGIENFVPVSATRYADDIPHGVDVVYSVCVMQHLSRSLVHGYLAGIGRKLRGSMVLQFLDQVGTEDDAQEKVYEPSVSWPPERIAAAAHGAGLTLAELRTEKIREGCLWHWAHLKNDPAARPSDG